jgi:hypothetical protein
MYNNLTKLLILSMLGMAAYYTVLRMTDIEGLDELTDEDWGLL